MCSSLETATDSPRWVGGVKIMNDIISFWRVQEASVIMYATSAQWLNGTIKINISD